MDLLVYWNLRERPFEAVWDSRFFFPSKQHDEALERLTFLAQDGGMQIGMLTGEIGCGKTLIRGLLEQRLESGAYKVISRDIAGVTFNQFLEFVLEQLGVKPVPRQKLRRFDRLQEALGKLAAEGKRLILILDEAQGLSPAALNEFKLLTNLNGNGKSLLTIILIGQPELNLLAQSVPAIDQRISLRFHLSALSQREAPAYFSRRLQAAGHPNGDLFTPEAAERAFHGARGIPRQLNRIGKLALEYAWYLETPRIETAAVETVLRDFENQTPKTFSP